PAELLLAKLIPSPRAPEFSSGLIDLPLQVAATIEELQPLVRQAEKAGVLARPICFQTENVGLDLARIAADQEGDALLLGGHRALLQADVLKAMVFRTFVAAPCDVAVLVDRGGRGIVAGDGRPVVALMSGGSHDAAACATAAHLAKALGTGVHLAGYLGKDG